MTAPLFKITGLTALNVSALNEVLTGTVEYRDTRWVNGAWMPCFIDVEVDTRGLAGHVTTTATTASFDIPAQDVMRALAHIVAQLPRRGHPKASLHAVARKVRAVYEAGQS